MLSANSKLHSGSRVFCTRRRSPYEIVGARLQLFVVPCQDVRSPGGVTFRVHVERIHVEPVSSQSFANRPSPFKQLESQFHLLRFRFFSDVTVSTPCSQGNGHVIKVQPSDRLRHRFVQMSESPIGVWLICGYTSPRRRIQRMSISFHTSPVKWIHVKYWSSIGSREGNSLVLCQF